MDGSLSFLVEFYYFLTGVPWAEVGFWFCAFWTLIGFLIFLITLYSSDKTALLMGIGILSVPVLLLSLFGHLAFGG